MQIQAKYQYTKEYRLNTCIFYVAGPLDDEASQGFMFALRDIHFRVCLPQATDFTYKTTRQ